MKKGWRSRRQASRQNLDCETRHRIAKRIPSALGYACPAEARPPPNYDTWEPFTACFPYRKQQYLARLPDGETVPVWPNAGMLNALDGTGRVWLPDAGVWLRALREHEQPGELDEDDAPDLEDDAC